MKDGGSDVLSSVQVLRGLAASMVVLFHLPFYIGYTESVSVLRAGVDLFFVISGFVMMVSTIDKRDDVVGFVRRRLLRVVPLYWLATLAFAMVWMLAGIREVPLSELAMSLLFIPYFDGVSQLVQPILGVGWTLNLELCFYALFALSMFLRPWMQVAALSMLFLALIGVRVVTDPTEQSVLFFYTTPVLLEFAAGMALGLALPLIRMLPRLAGLALLIAGVGSMVVAEQFGLPRTLGLGVPALAIVAGAIALEPIFRTRPLAAFRTLGDASYALYLTHLIVLVSLQQLVVGWPSWIAAGSMLVACIVAALVTYSFVERPLLVWARGATRRRPAVA